MQAPLHSLKPVLQSKPQLPVQLASEFAGTAQLAHVGPHSVTSLSATHRPEQSCVPPGHMPVQAALFAMQLPAHSFCPVGHVAPQVVPSQVAVPPVGAVHGVHAAPQ